MKETEKRAEREMLEHELRLCVLLHYRKYKSFVCNSYALDDDFFEQRICTEVGMAKYFFEFFNDMLYSRGVKEKTLTLIRIVDMESENLFKYLINNFYNFNISHDLSSYRNIEDYIDALIEQDEDNTELYNQILKEVKQLWQ